MARHSMSRELKYSTGFMDAAAGAAVSNTRSKQILEYMRARVCLLPILLRGWLSRHLQ